MLRVHITLRMYFSETMLALPLMLHTFQVCVTPSGVLQTPHVERIR